MNFGKKILIVAAHPDDEILGVGGSIPLFKKDGAQVDIVIITDGSSTQYAGDEEILVSKHKEAEKAANILGIDKIFQLSFPDMRLDTVPHVDINKALENLISRGHYDCVFCQEPGDINMDHRKLYDSTSVAVRPHPFQNVRKFLTYYVNSSSEWGGIMRGAAFSPNVFIDISETLQFKLDSMAEYKTELRDYPHPRSLEALKNTAAYFGNMTGYPYAEAFRLIFSR